MATNNTPANNTPTNTWKTFHETNTLFWKSDPNLGLQHALSSYTLQKIKESDNLTDTEFDILKKLNTQAQCVTTDSQLPSYYTTKKESLSHIYEIIENVHPDDTIEGSAEHFALSLYQKQKTQEFLQLNSDFVTQQKAYLCLFTPKSYIFKLLRDTNKSFQIFVGNVGSPVPETLKQTIPVTKMYPLSHPKDSDFCLNYTNLHAFDPDRDRLFENHWSPDCCIPAKEIRTVIIVQKKFPKDEKGAVKLRKEWFSFLEQLIPLLKKAEDFTECRRKMKDVKRLRKIKKSQSDEKIARRRRKYKAYFKRSLTTLSTLPTFPTPPTLTKTL